MRRLVLIVVVVVMLVAGCGSGDDPSAEARDTDALPLDAVLVQAFGTDDIDRYRWEIEREAERRLIECMNDAGFEFTIPTPLPPGPSRADLESGEYAATNGFGIIDDFRTWLAEADIEAMQSDPNTAYLRTLSSGEIGRYLQTLEGDEPEPGQIAENAGCRGSAADEAYADWNTFLGLLPNYSAIAEERDTHPDWLAARADWRDCMAERGYDYAEPDAIRTDVELRMSATVQGVYPDGRLPLVLEDGRYVLDPVVEPLLEELHEFEVDAAVANFACTEPLAERFEAVERTVQQDYVDRNRAAIDELLAVTR